MTGHTPTDLPLVFGLFALMLGAVAVWHRRALAIALLGLGAIFLYRAFADGLGVGAVAAHLGAEWSVLTNLLLLLLGFEVLANQFERSNLPDHLPRVLPDNWTGGLVLLAGVFVLSGLLDNIAAAVMGGVVARHVYKGRVRVGYLAAIVASANAGGAGSVIGDTTTTLMWIHGISPIHVLPAYIAAVPAFFVFAVTGAYAQHRHQPILTRVEKGHPLQWRRLIIVAVVLATAVAANLAASALGAGERSGPWLGLALWAAILVTSLAARPDWSLLKPAGKGALFLAALVAAASLMPIDALPDPTWVTTLVIGGASAVFDNIPLTALALRQGGYDWALLAFAVGYGGSMVWFGSSAGVALTNLFPEGRSVVAWVREGWFVALGYLVGFFVLLGVAGWTTAA